jgi:hypothetical protein
VIDAHPVIELCGQAVAAWIVLDLILWALGVRMEL